jgi:hypothetical protein
MLNSGALTVLSWHWVFVCRLRVALGLLLPLAKLIPAAFVLAFRALNMQVISAVRSADGDRPSPLYQCACSSAPS